MSYQALPPEIKAEIISKSYGTLLPLFDLEKDLCLSTTVARKMLQLTFFKELDLNNIYSENNNKIINIMMLHYIKMHPEPGYYVFEGPLENLHAKWNETYIRPDFKHQNISRCTIFKASSPVEILMTYGDLGMNILGTLENWCLEPEEEWPNSSVEEFIMEEFWLKCENYYIHKTEDIISSL